MEQTDIRGYLFSLPERVLRSATAIAAGLARELSDVTLPASLRRTRLYQNMVASTLRFLVEQVGQVERNIADERPLADDFLLRRTAGNGIEAVGIIAFRASPVWVMAALADVSGAGRHLIREIAETLVRDGLLANASGIETADQLLAGLENTAEHLAETINTPPLDGAGLREDLRKLRANVQSIPTPAVNAVAGAWDDLKNTAAVERRSVFEVSTAAALGSLTQFPGALSWMQRASMCAVRASGNLFSEAVLDHYRNTFEEIRTTGYFAYWSRQFRPYLRAAALQFSPRRRSLTERLLGRKPPVI